MAQRPVTSNTTLAAPSLESVAHKGELRQNPASEWGNAGAPLCAGADVTEALEAFTLELAGTGESSGSICRVGSLISVSRIAKQVPSGVLYTCLLPADATCERASARGVAKKLGV